MEYIDILDKHGNPTGEKAPKADVHAKGLWHRAVHMWIQNSAGELLLQKRSESKENYPGFWDISVTGHVSAGETSTFAAVRELKEELNLEIKEKDLQQIGSYNVSVVLNDNTYFDNEFCDIFILDHSIEKNDIQIDTDEVADSMFVSVSDFQAMIADPSAKLVPHPEEYKIVLQYLAA